MTHCVKAAFMDFIQDYNTVLRECRVCQHLPQQTAVCHVLHHRVLAQAQTSVCQKKKNTENTYFLQGINYYYYYYYR